MSRSMKVTQSCLEHIYNHKAICKALLNEGREVAKALFAHKVRNLVLEHNMSPCGEIALIMLSSLNRSLYDYLDLTLRLSFTDCCFANRVHTHKIVDAATLSQAGSSIIDSYADRLDESRASCPQLERACSYIQANLEQDLSLSAVSAAVFISRSQLCVLFKKYTGSTFGEYVREQRMQQARTLLAFEPGSIDDIAAACGFHSATYFATVFKSEMGMSPSVFHQSFCTVRP